MRNFLCIHRSVFRNSCQAIFYLLDNQKYNEIKKPLFPKNSLSSTSLLAPQRLLRESQEIRFYLIFIQLELLPDSYDRGCARFN